MKGLFLRSNQTLMHDLISKSEWEGNVSRKEE